jgi:hypothetical protein
LAQIDLSTLPRTPLRNAPEEPTLPERGLLFFFADMVEEMLWGENGGPFATTRVIFAKQAGPERAPPDDTPEILHAFGERAGGFETGIIEYPPMALEPHVIDTFDEAADPDATALVASIEKTIGPLPVFTGSGSWDAITAAKPREYIQELNGCRTLSLSLHQMLGVATNIQGTAAELQATGTILLLQIDSDTSLHQEFMFCDGGAAQFWIEPSDLARRRFHKAWGTTEGH